MGMFIFDIFGLILAGGFIVDLIRAVNDDICNIHEVPEDSQPEPCPDDFDTLYINVACGDRSDCGYWLDSVKGMQNLTKGTENDEKI